MDEVKLKRLKDIMAVASQDVPSTSQVKELLATLIKAVKEALTQTKDSLKSDMSQSMKDCMSMCKSCETALGTLEKDLMDEVSSGDKKVADECYKAINREVYKLEQAVRNIEPYDDSKLEAKWSTVVSDLQGKIDEIKPFLLVPTEVRDALESIQEDSEKLDPSLALKGWDKTMEELKGSGKNVRLVGGTNGIQLYVDNVKKGTTKYINFVAGAGITLTPTTFGNQSNITISSSIGGAPEIPSGVIDGSNVTFTFLSAPKVIIVDQGRTLIINNGFTLVGLVATLDVSPQFSIFSI